ncbi:hypothetical protein ANCCAN_27869 [Ancylostoma caninum]|uniref:Uncharacterized protein n=1 Tax=Ancylostoma caninum TaxID=29170 RepID=A0A368F2T4_ANCCA|nr:hypothetical protein ANCCAN_27869 [Ancylostoma caninum]
MKGRRRRSTSISNPSNQLILHYISVTISSILRHFKVSWRMITSLVLLSWMVMGLYLEPCKGILVKFCINSPSIYLKSMVEEDSQLCVLLVFEWKNDTTMSEKLPNVLSRCLLRTTRSFSFI